MHSKQDSRASVIIIPIMTPLVLRGRRSTATLPLPVSTFATVVGSLLSCCGRATAGLLRASASASGDPAWSASAAGDAGCCATAGGGSGGALDGHAASSGARSTGNASAAAVRGPVRRTQRSVFGRNVHFLRRVFLPFLSLRAENPVRVSTTVMKSLGKLTS